MITYTCTHKHGLHDGCSVAIARLAALRIEPSETREDQRQIFVDDLRVGIVTDSVAEYSDEGYAFSLVGPINLGGPSSPQKVACSTWLDGVFAVEGRLGLY